jgi:mannose-6-phosphate isomerase-like protein (cupin superfamily)
MIEYFKDNGYLHAIIIYASFNESGIMFFTPEDFSQQLGYMNQRKGYVIDPHLHNYVERKVVLTQEVLFIKSGKVRVDFYDDDRNYLDSRILQKGDIILLAAGGHGFEFMEDAEMIEVKQGPYYGERDKVKFKHSLALADSK